MLGRPTKASQTDGLAFQGEHIKWPEDEKKAGKSQLFQKFENSDQRKPAM
jgi:hypothetical protein